ncbi:MAG: hypothetical protein V4677_16025 [Bacteroidota bacterium]
MVLIYLIVNAISYIGFSLWCLFKTNSTAESIGIGFLNNSGKTEYLSVYTGLEMGFGVFLALTAYFPKLRMAGLLFCVCIYAGLMIVRPAAALYYGNVSKITYILGVVEYVFGIWGIIILAMKMRESSTELF